MKQHLCHLDELEATRSRGVDLDDGSAIFLVLDGNEVRAYIDRCPHRGTPLAWKPHDYLDSRRQHIICATHGALFEIGTGLCVSGPCAGESLMPVAVTVEDGIVKRRPPRPSS